MISKTSETGRGLAHIPLHGPQGRLCPWDFLGKNTGMGSRFFLQGIFRNQGSNPHPLCFLHWQADSLPLPQALGLSASRARGSDLLLTPWLVGLWWLSTQLP